MSDYEKGSDMTVQNDPYKMSSWQAENVKSMNKMMGYHDMSDKANSTCPTSMKAQKVNKQVMK